MKILFASSLIVASLCAAPAFAQGLYIGPNGVGIDTGIDRDRGYDHDRDPRYYRPRDEGRSAYERRHRDEDDDD